MNAAAKTLGIQYDQARQEALLTAWADLFRSGVIAWGKSLNTPDPPHFHLTERGRRALETISSHPSNPGGYLRRITTIAPLHPVVHSYLDAALECYVSEHFKAAAVMLGAATEGLILGLRNDVTLRLKKQRKPIPGDLNDWMIKRVTDALTRQFDSIDGRKHRDLRALYDAYWRAFTSQVRLLRNEAGHPSNIDPVTPGSAEAAFLVFPELVRLNRELSKWVAAGFR
ncbi:MAG TPA: hypothetical protein VFT47_09520 [Vicinamibacterales bacterium]|nr:hypothetical protein [Vicinamibacterales bacterium]